MNFPFFIARRYFTSNRGYNIVNIISYISLFGVAVGTSALIIVMSVFNGFEDLILDMYNSFDPHLKITSCEGKTFNIEEIDGKLKNNIHFDSYSYVLNEKVLIEHRGAEIIAEIKGVDENYKNIVKLDEIIKKGEYFNDKYYRNKNVLVLGYGISETLGVNINNLSRLLSLTLPNRNSKYIKDTSDLVRSVFSPIGIFSVQSEYDNQFVLAPLNRVQNMLSRPGESSSVEISLNNPDKINEVKVVLQEMIGESFIVKSRFEQHEFLYKLLNTEKLAVFLILVFILIIASFNIISSLSMLMIEKQNDIKTFWKLGCSEKKIRYIFFIKGFMGVLVGSFLGLFIGVLFSLLQEHFGFISLEGGYVVNDYPINLVFTDLFIIEITVLFIGIIASFYPAKVLTKKFLKI